MSCLGPACFLLLCLPAVPTADDFERGLEALQKGDYALAVTCLDAYIRDNPLRAKAYYCRGVAHAKLKEPDKAIADFSEAIRLLPVYDQAFLERGFAYLGKRQYEKAIKDFDETIRLGPKEAKAYGGRALTYQAKGEDGKAIKDFDAAIRLGQKGLAIYTLRGDARLASGDSDGASPTTRRPSGWAPRPSQPSWARAASTN
jgi:tetratricopeptide (TPR) repeat protein